MSKKKKKIRNRAPGIIGDYWKANRQAERENEAARQKQAAEKGGKEKKGWAGWSTTEKTMLFIIIAGLIGIFIRYVVLR